MHHRGWIRTYQGLPDHITSTSLLTNIISFYYLAALSLLLLVSINHSIYQHWGPVLGSLYATTLFLRQTMGSGFKGIDPDSPYTHSAAPDQQGICGLMCSGQPSCNSCIARSTTRGGPKHQNNNMLLVGF